MNKKLLVLSLVGAMGLTSAISLASCNNKKPEDNNPVQPVEKTLTVNLEGSLTKGEKIIISIKDEAGNAINDAKIEATSGTNLVTIDGNTVTLNDVGDVTLKITKDGFKAVEKTFKIEAPVLKTMEVKFEGKYYKGETINILVNNADGSILDDYSIEFTTGGDIISNTGNKIVLLDSGKIEGKITAEGYEDAPFSIEVNNVLTIKEIKENLDTYNGKLVTIRGVVTASYGNTFFVMNGKEGFYVYNIETSPMFGDPGDGFELGRVKLNTPVLVTAYVENGKYGLQLSGFQDGGYAMGCSVQLSTMDAKDVEVYEVKTEAELQSLTKQPTLAGSRVRITGKFLSGDFSSLESQRPDSPIFKMTLGSVPYTLKFDKHGSEMAVKKYWNAEKIEPNDYVTVEGNFTNFKEETITVMLTDDGTVVHNETKDPTRIKVSASAESVQVESKVTLNATLPEGVTGDVTYKIIKGEEFATIEGNELKGVAPGSVTLIATVGEKESLPFEILVTAQAFQTVAEVNALEIGSKINLKANVVAVTNNGIVLGDATGRMFGYMPDSYDFPQIGKTLHVKGNLGYFEDYEQKQITDFTYEEIEALEYTPVYEEKTMEQILALTPEEIALGALVKVDVELAESFGFDGNGSFTHPALNDSKIFVAGATMDLTMNLGWGNVGKVFTISGVIGATTEDWMTGSTNYVMYLTSVEEVPAKEITSITIATKDNKTEMGLDGTTGNGRVIVSFDFEPFGGDKSSIELVAIEGADLVTIEADTWTGGWKVKAKGVAGTVKIQAKSGDTVSNIITLTIA